MHRGREIAVANTPHFYSFLFLFFTLNSAKKNFSNQLFFVMKVINYTALKKIEDSIYKQKAAEKSLKLSSRSIKFKRYSNFFVNTLGEEILAGRKFGGNKIWRNWREFNLADANKF